MFATSSGVPRVPSGMKRERPSSIATPPTAKALLAPSVGIGPGAITFTVILSFAHSSARVLVSASIPALAAVACAICGQPL